MIHRLYFFLRPKFLFNCWAIFALYNFIPWKRLQFDFKWPWKFVFMKRLHAPYYENCSLIRVVKNIDQHPNCGTLAEYLKSVSFFTTECCNHWIECCYRIPGRHHGLKYFFSRYIHFSNQSSNIRNKNGKTFNFKFSLYYYGNLFRW